MQARVCVCVCVCVFVCVRVGVRKRVRDRVRAPKHLARTRLPQSWGLTNRAEITSNTLRSHLTHTEVRVEITSNTHRG